MNEKFNWKYIAEAMAVVSVILTLGFLAYEMRLSRVVALSERGIAMYEIESDVRTLIVENSETWYKGCIGDPLTPQEQVVFDNIARMVADWELTRWVNLRTGIVDLNRRRTATDAALNRYRFPGLNDFWEREHIARSSPLEDVRTSEWKELVDSIYQELIDNGIKRDVSVGACGR